MPKKNFKQQSEPASSPIAEADNQKSFPLRRLVWASRLPNIGKQIGISVWVYLWCVRCVTCEEGDLGFVLGGSLIKVIRIAQELGVCRNEALRQIWCIAYEGVVISTSDRIPYGLVITVSRSKRKLTWQERVQLPAPI